MSYAVILKHLKNHIKPDELGVTVQNIRKTRSKDLVKLKYSKKSRRSLNSAFKEVIGANESIRHLISRIEVENADIDPSTEAEDVEEALKGFFDHGSELELKRSLTNRLFRGERDACILLEETRALKLLKTIHIKIEWVSSKLHRKTMANQCYRCLGFGHMATDCRGPGPSRSRFCVMDWRKKGEFWVKWILLKLSPTHHAWMHSVSTLRKNYTRLYIYIGIRSRVYPILADQRSPSNLNFISRNFSVFFFSQTRYMWAV